MKIEFDDNELEKMSSITYSDTARAGSSNKGDVIIKVESQKGCGLVLEIESSVKSLFGGHLEKLVALATACLGVDDMIIRLDDHGALDHVILARLEAALRQIRNVPEPGLLPEVKIQANPSSRDRLRRTRLYLPGNNPDLALNAGLFGADCIILDLEDSVAPQEKAAARILVRNTLRTVDFGTSERIVRINPISSPYGEQDLESIIPAAPDTILIPKCESAMDVSLVEERIVIYENETKPEMPIFLMPLIESAKGILNAQDIAFASDRNVALCFGAEDFTADIGAERTSDGRESFVARSILVMAAKAAGLQAIDTVFSDVQDSEGLISSAKEARSLGFDGKGVLHPSQIKPVHDVFVPTKEEIEYAQRIMEAMDTAKAKGSGIATLGSKMIDAPVAARAKRILLFAKKAIIPILCLQ